MSHQPLLRVSKLGLLLGLVGCSETPSSPANKGGSPNLGGFTASGAASGTAATSGGSTSQTARGGSGGTTSSASGASALGGSTQMAGGSPSLGGTTTTTGVGGTSAAGGVAGKGGAASFGGVAGKSGAASFGGVAGKSGAASGGVTATGKGGAATGGVSGSATGGAATAGTSSVAVGNPDGHCTIPAEAQLEDTSTPTHVVGSGTAASCTGAEFVKQVALGGVITFNCGADPVTINLDQTAKIVNNTGPRIVIDGGGKVTLSGQDKVRILYQNTCDEAQIWTTDHCDNQDHPQLTIQNLTFVHGNAKTETDGGGAIFARGGRLKIINSRFFNNVCADTGQDIGGAAVRAYDEYNDLPLFVVNSTFGGRSDLGNSGSNGGGVSSIGVSWTILNSLFSYNSAIGNGGNPAATGTPGGGSGGAIYNDGNTMTLSLCGTLIEHNTVKAYGGAIFFVSNDKTGSVNITDSIIRNNPGGSWYPKYPGISHHAETPVTVVNSTITE